MNDKTIKILLAIIGVDSKSRYELLKLLRYNKLPKETIMRTIKYRKYWDEISCHRNGETMWIVFGSEDSENNWKKDEYVRIVEPEIYAFKDYQKGIGLGNGEGISYNMDNGKLSIAV